MEVEIEHISGPITFEKGSKIIVAIHARGAIYFEIYLGSIAFDFDPSILKLDRANSPLAATEITESNTTVDFNVANGDPASAILEEYACLAQVEFSIVADKENIVDAFFIGVTRVVLVGDQTYATIHIAPNMSLGFSPDRMRHVL